MTRLIIGHVLDKLTELPAESVHCVVTSPPYYGLRDYGIEPQMWGGEAGCEHEWEIEHVPTERGGGNWAQGTNGRGELQPGGVDAAREPMRAVAERGFCRHCNAWRGSLGLEPTPALYVEHMVAVFREVRRVLRKDGTLWLNIGDSYAMSTKGAGGSVHADRAWRIPTGIKAKDLLGIPWMLAFALRDDGWYLRSEVTWAKRAPMPESVTDRPTSATEKVFLLAKGPRYFYDAEAVKEESAPRTAANYALGLKFGKGQFIGSPTDRRMPRDVEPGEFDAASGRNMRNWWLLGPEPFPEAHFATFPTEIPRRAILAGTSKKGVCPKCGAPWARMINKKFTPQTDVGADRGLRGAFTTESPTIGWFPSCECAYKQGEYLAPVPATCLDPFLGAGTTALVADHLGRDCIGIELSPAYAEMARRRIEDDAGMFAQIAAE